MGCHLQLGCKILKLELVGNRRRRTHQDLHRLHALLTHLRALTLDILDQTLGGTLEEIAELLLRGLESIQNTVQDSQILGISFAGVSSQQERASKGTAGQQERLVDLHEKSRTDQALDCLSGFAVLLVGSRNLLDLVQHRIQLALIGNQLENRKQQKHQVLGRIGQIKPGTQRLQVLKSGSCRMKLWSRNDLGLN